MNRLGHAYGPGAAEVARVVGIANGAAGETGALSIMTSSEMLVRSTVLIYPYPLMTEVSKAMKGPLLCDVDAQRQCTEVATTRSARS